MATPSCKKQRPVCTPRTQDILRVWHDDRCVRASTAQQYLQWIGRFKKYCRALGLDEPAELTHDGARRFQAWYASSRQISTTHLGLAGSSVRSLRRVYEVMGMPIPPWRPNEPRKPPAGTVRYHRI